METEKIRLRDVKRNARRAEKREKRISENEKLMKTTSEPGIHKEEKPKCNEKL